MHSSTDEKRYDVVIIGGALAGAATALVLLREHPRLRILIVEKSSQFGRKVGEATVELSAYFLGRVLGLTQYLNESHLVKQGLRFWFTNRNATDLDKCSEIGGRYLARIPSYQVDRSHLDEEVLRRASKLGAEVWRPATTQKVVLNDGGEQTLEVKYQERLHQIQTRWVVDASGIAALLARQEGWWKPNQAHPTTSVWARWKNVRDWDGWELSRKYPCWAKQCYGIRGTATNHFMGDGWWAWCIPLKGGDVSVGVVFDQRLVEWPQGGSLGQRLKDFLSQHPVAREILADAQWTEGDVHWRKNLPYYSTKFAGDGFALVGDAAAFIDPFYSPGMDWISFSVMSAKELIASQQRGEPLEQRVKMHNESFARSYERWFNAVYRDKYYYMGDFELMRLAFLLDLGFYYFGVAAQPFRLGVNALKVPLFSNAPSVPCYHLMRTYNRRLARIAQSRRLRGNFGAANAMNRFMFPGYAFNGMSTIPIFKALLNWGILELKEGWRTWRLGPDLLKGDILDNKSELAPVQ